jgi:hypothetical protein
VDGKFQPERLQKLVDKIGKDKLVIDLRYFKAGCVVLNSLIISITIVVDVPRMAGPSLRIAGKI